MLASLQFDVKINKTKIFSSVTHAYTWKLIKPNMLDIIKYVIFPILQYTETDEELWEEDPKEYIRTKYGTSYRTMISMGDRQRPTKSIQCHLSVSDIYDDYSTAVPSAQELFFTCCKTRKGILQESMGFLMSVSWRRALSIQIKIELPQFDFRRSFHRLSRTRTPIQSKRTALCA